MSLTGTNRGTGGNNTGATSIACAPTSNFGVGSFAVLCLAYDNTGTSGADPFVSISDSLNNVWTPREAALYDPGAAAAGVSVRIFTSNMHRGKLTTSDTVTISFGADSVVAKHYAFHEITAGVGNFVQYVNSGVNTGAATGTPTVTTGSITNTNLVIGCGGAESANTWTGDADTTNGSWSAQQAGASGTGTTGISITSQRKVVTASATQTYNPTLTSADCILAWAQFSEYVIPLEPDEPPKLIVQPNQSVVSVCC